MAMRGKNVGELQTNLSLGLFLLLYDVLLSRCFSSFSDVVVTGFFVHFIILTSSTCRSNSILIFISHRRVQSMFNFTNIRASPTLLQNTPTLLRRKVTTKVTCGSGRGGNNCRSRTPSHPAAPGARGAGLSPSCWHNWGSFLDDGILDNHSSVSRIQ